MSPYRKPLRRWAFGAHVRLERVWASTSGGEGWYAILPDGRRVPVEIREVRIPKEKT